MRVNPKLLVLLGLFACVVCSGCTHRSAATPALQAKAAGTAIVVVSGDKQVGSPGTELAQSLVVQVNDAQGSPVTGARVDFSVPMGATVDPAQMLTDDSGQATVKVRLGGISGRYELTASSADTHGKKFSIGAVELAGGYQQEIGYEVNEKYCSRCHDSESTAEQVSNYDNLAVKPHGFGNGDVNNKLSDSDLATIIGHGGPAMNRSALMPPYGWTLDKAQIQATIAYIRLVSDPPYAVPGIVYAKH